MIIIMWILHGGTTKIVVPPFFYVTIQKGDVMI